MMVRPRDGGAMRTVAKVGPWGWRGHEIDGDGKGVVMGPRK